MTFVGKILVILIMAFSLVFLGVSTVVFTTSTNWKAKTEEQAKQISKLQGDVGTKDALAKDAEGKLSAAATKFAADLKEKDGRVEELTKANQAATAELGQAQGALESAQKNAQTSLDEANARRKEVDSLRQTLAAVEKQANDFKLVQTELNDQIRELKRSLDVAERNSKNLRERSLKLATLLRSKGLPDDVSQIEAVSVPPKVEGKVLRIDPTNRQMEISIGSDDGLAPGQEFYVWRTTPRPEYLGKVKISTVDPDQAVASVIGRTVNGKKIQEGDIVSSSFDSR